MTDISQRSEKVGLGYGTPLACFRDKGLMTEPNLNIFGEGRMWRNTVIFIFLVYFSLKLHTLIVEECWIGWKLKAGLVVKHFGSVMECIIYHSWDSLGHILASNTVIDEEIESKADNCGSTMNTIDSGDDWVKASSALGDKNNPDTADVTLTPPPVAEDSQCSKQLTFAEITDLRERFLTRSASTRSQTWDTSYLSEF